MTVPLGGRGTSNECANAKVNTSTTTPDILFVIDGSGSMCETFGGSTRWQALRTALLDPTNGLVQRLQASARFGMVLYDGTIDLLLALTAIGGSSNPECALMYTATKAEGMCPQLIEVPIALNNAPALDMAFPQTELGGSTPTDKAMAHAVELLLGMRSGDPDAEQNPQYIILATDGQPNDICLGGVGGDGAAQKQGVIAAVDRAKMNKRLFDALKPGGRFVLIDHSALPGTGIAAGKTLHRIEEAFVVNEVKAAGFVLETDGKFLRNPDDPRDVTSNSPKIPTDKFALRFLKPRS